MSRVYDKVYIHSKRTGKPMLNQVQISNLGALIVMAFFLKNPGYKFLKKVKANKFDRFKGMVIQYPLSFHPDMEAIVSQFYIDNKDNIKVPEKKDKLKQTYQNHGK